DVVHLDAHVRVAYQIELHARAAVTGVRRGREQPGDLRRRPRPDVGIVTVARERLRVEVVAVRGEVAAVLPGHERATTIAGAYDRVTLGPRRLTDPRAVHPPLATRPLSLG